MQSIYDLILEELASREAYLHEVYAPLYVCSYAVHAFNLMNQHREIYFSGKRLPNMRVHILFISPSGFMKTYYLDNMGRDSHSGIFYKTDVSIGAEQSMTEAGFVGTIASVNGLAISSPGAAELNKDGILLVDEFKGITEALKNLPFHSKLVLSSVYLLSKGQAQQVSVTGNIYEVYCELCQHSGMTPLTQRRVSGLVNELDAIGLLNTQVINMGRYGRTKKNSVRHNSSGSQRSLR
jgi:hypothetical protein